ncbi:nucleotidyltransferase family protein [Candidatus Poribacteria bacterium]
MLALEQLSTDGWDEVVRCASGHGVYPIIYKRLESLGSGTNIPELTVQRLRKVYFHSMKRNMRLYHELSNVCELLREHDISVIVLKGAALGELVYQDIALRPMWDIDLMVKVEDVWRADEALIQSGCRRTMFPWSKRHMQWAHGFRHLGYMKGGIEVEIHVGIPELPDLDPWISARPATINSTDAFILSPENFLLNLCLHLDRHIHFDSLSLLSFCDIAMALKRYQEELDWHYVMRIVREHQVEESIHRILHVINEGFHGLVPVDVLAGLKSDGVTISINNVLYPDEEPKRMLPPSLSSWLLDFSRIPSVRNKIYHIYKKLFPCREYMIQYSPGTRPSLVYFYYPVRLCKEAVRTIRGLLQLLMYLKNRHVTRKG